jgi:hypothetical protein
MPLAYLAMVHAAIAGDLLDPQPRGRLVHEPHRGPILGDQSHSINRCATKAERRGYRARRRLRPGDFKDLPLNGDREHQSERLRDRIVPTAWTRDWGGSIALWAVHGWRLQPVTGWSPLTMSCRAGEPCFRT